MSIELFKESHLMVTSAGAYYCMAGPDEDFAKTLLRKMLCQQTTPYITDELLASWFSSDKERALESLHHLQNLNWVKPLDDEMTVASGKLEDLLPPLLSKLSFDKKALLAETNGLNLASVGFAHESTEEISALSADLVTLQSRHKGLLNGNLNFTNNSWGIIDAAGFSQLGFWPLHVGSEIFSLVISGLPQLQEQSFLEIAWILHTLYAEQT